MANKTMHFFVQCNPPKATAQERRARMQGGKAVFYDPPNLLAAKETLEAYLRPFAPEEPFDCPVRLSIQWRFAYGKSGHKDGEYKRTRPDLDNLHKALQDIMTKLGYWTDDNLVVEVWAQKIWHNAKPGLNIQITPLGEGIGNGRDE